VLFLSKYTGNNIYYTVHTFLFYLLALVHFSDFYSQIFLKFSTLFRESSENLGLGLKRCSDTKAIVIDSIKEASLADRSATMPAMKGT
jgi:hypothetical protein